MDWDRVIDKLNDDAKLWDRRGSLIVAGVLAGIRDALIAGRQKEEEPETLDDIINSLR
jgi:hypothetical protein